MRSFAFVSLCFFVCACSALPAKSNKEEVKVEHDLVALATGYHSSYAPEVHSNKYGDEHDSYGKYSKGYDDNRYNRYGKF